MLKKMDIAVKKTERAATKKMAGFLSKTDKKGEGIFDEESRNRDTSGVGMPAEPVKMSEGLWVVSKEQESAARRAAGADPIMSSRCKDGDDKIEFDEQELSREIAELQEEDPETFAELQAKVATYIREKDAESNA